MAEPYREERNNAASFAPLALHLLFNIGAGAQHAGRGSGDKRQWPVVVRRDPLRIEASPSPIDGR